MENTLFTGDVIIVNKLNYGAVLPQTIDDVPFLEGLLYIFNLDKGAKNLDWSYKRAPGLQRFRINEIMVFKSLGNESIMVKRCVGLPGDTLAIKHNDKYVNNILQNESNKIKFSFLSAPLKK
jgi:signal peptidase I